MSNSWTPVWEQLVHSSVWREELYVRVLWTSMLAVKDRHFIVWGDSYKLASKFNMPELQVIEGLKILAAPDTRRIGPQDFDGRRIQFVPATDEQECGWFILNGEKYTRMMRKQKKRSQKAAAQARWREKQSLLKAENEERAKAGLAPVRTAAEIRAQNDSRERRHGKAADIKEEEQIASEGLPGAFN